MMYEDCAALDATVGSRIEGLKLLAHHLAEPIAISNPQMEIVYANPSAARLVDCCPLMPTPVKEHSLVPSNIIHPCESCPGKRLFEDRQPCGDSFVSFLSTTGTGPSTCPLPWAVPLCDAKGTVHFAVLMGPQRAESVVLGAQDGAHLVSRHAARELTEGSLHNPIIGESAPIRRLVEMIRLVRPVMPPCLFREKAGPAKNWG